MTRGPEPGLQPRLGNSPQHQDRKRQDPGTVPRPAPAVTLTVTHHKLPDRCFVRTQPGLNYSGHSRQHYSDGFLTYFKMIFLILCDQNFEYVFVNINIFQPGAQFDNIHDPHPP